MRRDITQETKTVFCTVIEGVKKEFDTEEEATLERAKDEIAQAMYRVGMRGVDAEAILSFIETNQALVRDYIAAIGPRTAAVLKKRETRA